MTVTIPNLPMTGTQLKTALDALSIAEAQLNADLDTLSISVDAVRSEATGGTGQTSLPAGLSVLSYATPALAVAAAKAADAELYWPAGDYAAAATIPNLHAVRHRGPGRVVIGSDVFYPDPQSGQAQTIYVGDVAGPTGNDGLTAARPIRYTEVRALLKNYGPNLRGSWRFKIAAGDYAHASAFAIRIGPDNENEIAPNIDTLSANHIVNADYVIFEGPDVGYDPVTNPAPVPTAIFDAYNASTVLFDFRGGFRAYVKNIKFKNARGSASSGGVHCTNGALRCENVHTEACTYGISGLEGCLLEVKGGVIQGALSGTANTGIRSLFHCKHDIGNQGAGAPGQGPFIRNCSIGFFAQESSTGHSDFVTYEDNAIAISANVNSRVNMNGSEFRRNGLCGRAQTGSNLGWNGNESLNIGTANENGATFNAVGGSLSYVGSLATNHISYPITYKTIVIETDLGTATGTTAETYPVKGFVSLPPGAVFGTATSIFPGKVLRFRVTGVMTGSAGEKSIKIRLGEFGGVLNLAASVSAFAAQTGAFVMTAQVFLRDLGTQAWNAKITTNTPAATGQASKVANGVTSYDLGIAARYQIRVGVALANAADSVTINTFEVEAAGMF